MGYWYRFLSVGNLGGYRITAFLYSCIINALSLHPVRQTKGDRHHRLFKQCRAKNVYKVTFLQSPLSALYISNVRRYQNNRHPCFCTGSIPCSKDERNVRFGASITTC